MKCLILLNVLFLLFTAGSCQKDTPLQQQTESKSECETIINNASLYLTYISESNYSSDDYRIYPNGYHHLDINFDEGIIIKNNCLYILVDFEMGDDFQLVWDGKLKQANEGINVDFILHYVNIKDLKTLGYGYRKYDLTFLKQMTSGNNIIVNLKAHGIPSFFKQIEYKL